MRSDGPSFYAMDPDNYLPPMMPMPSHPAATLMQRVPERVPVAPSMLFTYAHMRGRNEHYFDPLHHALYPASNRQVFTHRVWLPPIARKASLEGLPRGATFFWDPITCTNLRPRQQLPPTLHGGTYQPPKDQQPLTYDEYICQNPPAVGKNHYRGDKVWANFGYYLAEGKWVDPESEGELHNAYINPASSHTACPNPPALPRLHDNGPRIMIPQEQDEFYKDFEEDVTDEHDGEGDPRAWRISPATFAQWAAGAVAGDRYEEGLMVMPEKLFTSKRSNTENQRIPPRPKPEMQFDKDTGSLLSGIYEPERSPSLLQGPLGVDVIRPPPSFNYSYPGVMRDLERHGFGAAWCDRRERGNASQSVASTPEVFTSERAQKNLVNPEDPRNGNRDYEYMKDNIYRMREQGERGWNETIEQLRRAQEVADRHIEICRQIHFLKEYLENHTFLGDKRLVMRMSATLKDIPRRPTPPTPTPKRRQYRRYINEAEEHETLQITRMNLLGARLKSDHRSLLDETAVKENERLQLLNKVGIQSVDDIPGLVPRRPSCDDL